MEIGVSMWARYTMLLHKVPLYIDFHFSDDSCRICLNLQGLKFMPLFDIKSHGLKVKMTKAICGFRLYKDIYVFNDRSSLFKLISSLFDTFRFWFLWLVGSVVWLNWEGIKIALDLNDVSVAFCAGCIFFPTLNFTFWKSFSLSLFFLLLFGILMKQFQNVLVQNDGHNSHVGI